MVAKQCLKSRSNCACDIARMFVVIDKNPVPRDVYREIVFPNKAGLGEVRLGRIGACHRTAVGLLDARHPLLLSRDPAISNKHRRRTNWKRFEWPIKRWIYRRLAANANIPS